MIKARASVLRSLLFYSPFFVVMWILQVLVILNGTLVVLVLLTPLTLVLTWHVSNLARDLRSDLITIEGEIRRKWSRFDLPIRRSYYIYVGTTVYSIPRDAWGRLETGDQVSISSLP